MPDRSYCTGLCRLVERQRESAQRLYETLGDTPLTASLIARAEAMDTAWSEYQEIHQELHDAALSVGVTEEQWSAIKEGRVL